MPYVKVSFKEDQYDALNAMLDSQLVYTSLPELIRALTMKPVQAWLDAEKLYSQNVIEADFGQEAA